MKKLLMIVSFFIITLNLLVQSAFAFTFPEPDWGALLRERESMTSATDFELYGEAPVDYAPYFGARLEPTDGVYLGMIAETAADFEPLSSYLTYIEDMYQEDIYYPANVVIMDGDAAVMAGWTIYDINNVDYKKINNTLNTLSHYGRPMFIRFANEMNVSSVGDDPDKYIEVFRNVADIVHKYDDFAVVWSPNDIGALDRPFEYFYPGDEYVDWIGVSSYMIKYFQGNPNTDPKNEVYFMTGDWAWTTNRLKPIIDFMERNGIKKPLMISEGGAATNNKMGEELSAWASPRLRNMLWYAVMKYPQIKMINYFNNYRADETERFDISSYGYAAQIYKEAAASGVYKRSISRAADFSFAPLSGLTLNERNGAINIYTEAYIPGESGYAVNYSIDGKWYASSDKIPYKCSLNTKDIADGEHLLRAWTLGCEKEYWFIKQGSTITFEGTNDEIKVIVNGKRVTFDAKPFIRDDRTLVPLRAIFEALGAEVTWNGEERTVSAVKNKTNISLTIDSSYITVNGDKRLLDVPAIIESDRTYVPVRAISESFDCNVVWSAKTRAVIVTE